MSTDAETLRAIRKLIAEAPIENRSDGVDLGAFVEKFATALIAEVKKQLATERRKDWYSVDELAEAVGKKPFTVRENWCNGGKIECKKDPYSGKWRIPASEYDRLVAGGSIRITKATE